MFDTYEIVYWITGILVVLAYYNVTIAFSSKEPRNPKRDALILTTYYFLSLLVHYFANYPLLNLALSISLFVALCSSIGITWKKTITTIVYVVVIMSAIEVIVSLATGYVAETIVQEAEYKSIVGRLASSLLAYAIGTGIRRFRNIRKDVNVPLSYWLLLTFYPLLSVVLLLLVFSYSEVQRSLVMTGASIILIMNILLFTLYDRLIILFEKRMEDMAIKSLNRSYQKQLDLMKSSIQDTMSIKHDFMKHLNSIQTHISSGSPEKAEEYLSNVRNQVTDSEMFSHTGNLIIDSIINFSLNQFGLSHDQVELVSQNIPSELEIADYDLTIILSNLLNNAFRASRAAKDGKTKIKLDYNKGMFLIEVINDYNWTLKKAKGLFATNQEDGDAHGYGLNNVLDAVGKYDGKLNISTTDTIFTAEVFMYENHV